MTQRLHFHFVAILVGFACLELVHRWIEYGDEDDSNSNNHSENSSPDTPSHRQTKLPATSAAALSAFSSGELQQYRELQLAKQKQREDRIERQRGARRRRRDATCVDRLLPPLRKLLDMLATAKTSLPPHLAENGLIDRILEAAKRLLEDFDDEDCEQLDLESLQEMKRLFRESAACAATESQRQTMLTAGERELEGRQRNHEAILQVLRDNCVSQEKVDAYLTACQQRERKLLERIAREKKYEALADESVQQKSMQHQAERSSTSTDALLLQRSQDTMGVPGLQSVKRALSDTNLPKFDTCPKRRKIEVLQALALTSITQWSLH